MHHKNVDYTSREGKVSERNGVVKTVNNLMERQESSMRKREIPSKQQSYSQCSLRFQVYTGESVQFLNRITPGAVYTNPTSATREKCTFENAHYCRCTTTVHTELVHSQNNIAV